jgi:signal transduction histidine kinase
MADAAIPDPPDLTSPEGEAGFAQLFRYAQVGRCTNAVTHDINNLLGAAMAYAELIGLDKELPPGARRMLGEIIEAVSKGSALIGHLTAVARPDRPTVTTVRPDDLVQRAVYLRQYDFRQAKIDIEVDVAPGLPSLLVDLPKAQMALVYLLFNAQEALDGITGVRQVRVTATPCDDAEGVQFRVWNSAPPVPEPERGRLFAPFNTTKAGFHFGYGLAAVKAIAEYHAGAVTYDPAHGFSFTIHRAPRSTPDSS